MLEKFQVVIKFLNSFTTTGKVLLSIVGFLIMLCLALFYQGCVTIAAKDDERFLLYHDKEVVIKHQNGQNSQESSVSEIYDGAIK